MSSTFHELVHPRKISDIAEGEITIYGSSDGGTTWHPIGTDTSGRINVLSGLISVAYDHVSLSYSGNNITGAVYKTGGAGGTVVATLAITYDGNDNILTVTKT